MTNKSRSKELNLDEQEKSSKYFTVKIKEINMFYIDIILKIHNNDMILFFRNQDKKSKQTDKSFAPVGNNKYRLNIVL
jgi:hypothetical protein